MNLSSFAAQDRWTDFYFVCDLQDGEDEEGIREMRRSLNSGRLPKRLHLISFGKQPETLLARLIKETKSSFIYLDPLVVVEKE